MTRSLVPQLQVAKLPKVCSQFREVRPGFEPTPKLALYWKVILVLLLGVRREGKTVWVAPFLHLPNIGHSLRAVPDKVRGT